MPGSTPPGGATQGGLAATSTNSTQAYLPAPAAGDAAVPWFALSTRQSPDLPSHLQPEQASPARAISLSGINPRVAAGPPPSPALPTRLFQHVAAGGAEPARAKSHSGWAPVASSGRDLGASAQRPLSSSGYGSFSPNGTLSGATVHLAGAPAAAYMAGAGLSTAGSAAAGALVYDNAGRTGNGHRKTYSGAAGTAGAGGDGGVRQPPAGASPSPLRSVASFKMGWGSSNRIAAGGSFPAARAASVSSDGRLRLDGVDPSLTTEIEALGGSRQEAQGYTGMASSTHPRARQTAPSTGDQQTNRLSADGSSRTSSPVVPSALSGVAALRAAGGMAGAVRTRSPASRPSRWTAASESGTATGGSIQAPLLPSPRASPLLQDRERAAAGAAGAAAGGPTAPDDAGRVGAAGSGSGGGRITSRLRGVGGAGRVSFNGAVPTADAPASVRGPPYPSTLSQPGSPTQPGSPLTSRFSPSLASVTARASLGGSGQAAAAAVPSLEPRTSTNGEGGGGGGGSGRAAAARLSSPLGSGFSRLRAVVNANAAAVDPAAAPAAPGSSSALTDRPSAPSSSSWLAAGRSRLFTRTQKRLVTPPPPAAATEAAPRRSTTSVGMIGAGASGGPGHGLRQSEGRPQEQGRGVSAGQVDFGLRATPLFGRRALQGQAAGGEEGYVISAPSSPSARPARAQLLRAQQQRSVRLAREAGSGSGGPVEWRDNMLARMQDKD